MVANFQGQQIEISLLNGGEVSGQVHVVGDDFISVMKASPRGGRTCDIVPFAAIASIKPADYGQVERMVEEADPRDQA